MPERIAVLAGGHSPEREVSLRSGHRVATALAARGHDAFVLDPADAPLVETLSERAVVCCYVALHGKDGEDGTVQRVLELLGIEYTGTRPFACHVAFDKVLAKEALRSGGVRTPPWVTVQAPALRDLAAGPILHRIGERIGFPVVVKPSRAGSAMGLSFVERQPDLASAVMNALSFSDAVVVERKVAGTEIAVGMVGDPADPLPLVEVVPKSEVFDYAARYTPGTTEYYAPARVSDEVAASCRDEATKTFRALSIRDVGRADVIVDGDGGPWVIDVNVSPGMTDTSLLPMAGAAAGVDLPELCDRVVQLALSRREQD